MAPRAVTSVNLIVKVATASNRSRNRDIETRTASLSGRRADTIHALRTAETIQLRLRKAKKRKRGSWV
jgi:hypothetical protein